MTYLNGIVHSHRKTVKVFFFFWQLGMFDVCNKGDMAHIDTIFKFLPHTLQHGCIDILHCCNDPCLKVSEVTWQWYFAYLTRTVCCTVTTELLVWYYSTQTTFPPKWPFSHYIHPSPSDRNVNYDKKKQLIGKKIELFLLSVQVS